MDPTHAANLKPPKSSSCRIWQRHDTKCHRTLPQSLHNKAAVETSHHHHTMQHIDTQINLMSSHHYNLYLDPLKSSFQNAVGNITTTPETEYYNTSKLAFHDLTKGNHIPSLAPGMKFIRTPAFATGDISTSITHFEQDIHL